MVNIGKRVSGLKYKWPTLSIHGDITNFTDKFKTDVTFARETLNTHVLIRVY